MYLRNPPTMQFYFQVEPSCQLKHITADFPRDKTLISAINELQELISVLTDR